jgi:hypothetical protein
MSANGSIPIIAVVTSDERRALDRAAKELGDAISQSIGQSWTCKCDFTSDVSSLRHTPADAIVITSLGVAMTRLHEAWTDVEQELRKSYAMLSTIGVPVMICTLFRRVGDDGDAKMAGQILRRIRQLNLLATELSQEFGALVIDLDRVLADVGARRLDTDYRLRGTKATEVAGNAIARCIAADALDAFVDVDNQQAVQALLESRRPDSADKPAIVPTNVLAFGPRRNRQLAATVTDTVQEHHAAWLMRQVLNRQIGPRDALLKLGQAVRRRGARESAALLLAGVTRLLKGQKR